ncbi:MAG: NAD(P)-dependent glycerol-3-phosphate dehydrogenase [Betaproteobacteria bacterium]|nr:MAG: NAD(P)-dependent glycerol-3-phosphate dehydrogenase [Betaproteobacteria bacterium]
MARVGIVGGGAFGTAMACVLRRSGHEVTLWAREPEVVAAINRERTNPLFLQGVPLDPAIHATGSMAAAVEGADFALLAPPAQHMRAVTLSLQPHLARGTPVVSCSKGIERGSCALMPEVLAQTLPHATVAVLSGPSFAREIAADLPCGVALACADFDLAKKLALEIRNPRFCVHPTSDVAGCAIGGVMKNVIAIASGIAAGLKLGENARATLVTLGADEAMRLGLAKGARHETFLGLAGIGDMMLTANSLTSRNASLGFALGEGKKLADILSERKEVTEGAFSTEAVVALARRLGLRMPITLAVDEVLNHGADIPATLTRLLSSWS